MNGIIIKNSESQLEMGIRIEAEHKDTADKIKAGTITTSEEIYKSIAEDHLKEDPEYYTKLAVMESK